MKFNLIVIILITIHFGIIANDVPVVNSCGIDKVKLSQNQPDSIKDCEDDENEPACKLVTVYKNNKTIEEGNTIDKKFCAVIHGKYNDKNVLDSVKSVIGRTVTVEGNGKFFKFKFIFIIGFLFGLF